MTDTAPGPPEIKTSVNVTLEEPIKRDGGDIAAVTVRRPLPEAMSGLSLRDIVDMEATTMRKLLPRITEPPLLASEVATMAPGDFLLLSAEASGFLLPRLLRPASPTA